MIVDTRERVVAFPRFHGKTGGDVGNGTSGVQVVARKGGNGK